MSKIELLPPERWKELEEIFEREFENSVPPGVEKRRWERKIERLRKVIAV
jgi:hypothetical protein